MGGGDGAERAEGVAGTADGGGDTGAGDEPHEEVRGSRRGREPEDERDVEYADGVDAQPPQRQGRDGDAKQGVRIGQCLVLGREHVRVVEVVSVLDGELHPVDRPRLEHRVVQIMNTRLQMQHERPRESDRARERVPPTQLASTRRGRRVIAVGSSVNQAR